MEDVGGVEDVGGSRMVSVCARCIGGILEALWQRREDPKESKRVREPASEWEQKRRV